MGFLDHLDNYVNVEEDLPFEDTDFDEDMEALNNLAMKAAEMAVDQFMLMDNILKEKYGIEEKTERYRIIEIINLGD